MSIFDSIKHRIEKGFWSLSHKIEKGLKDTGTDIKREIKTVGNETETTLRHTTHDLEHELKQAGDEIADGLTKGFGDLVALAEQGILDDALDKIADYAEKAAFDGSAPIPLRTAFLDIEVTDAKALARWIRSLVENGLPTSKSDWRHAIVELAPKAITIKPGVPLIAQLVNRIPLEELEETALDKLLREAGLE